jgi:hypothetical protein
VLLGYVRAGGGHLRDVSIHPDTIKAARAPMQATINAMKPAWAYDFDDSQCGGVFDGRQVTSDADPGL